MMTMFGINSELITSHHAKGQQAVSLFEESYNKARLDDGRAQRLNERGIELKGGIAKLISELSLLDRYEDEEVFSGYGYHSGYAPKPFAKQIVRLMELFPQIAEYDGDIVEGAVPKGSEGWFAIPRFEMIAPTYGEAVQIVLDLIKDTRGCNFSNCEGQFGPDRLRQSDRKVAALEELYRQQQDDIIFIPAQFGITHRGRSVRRAREVFDSSEFGLGSYEVGIMLLTHPERLQHYDDLWIHCAGDEYGSKSDGDFSSAPHFDFKNGKVEFVSHWGVSNVGNHCGSASGLIPR